MSKKIIILVIILILIILISVFITIIYQKDKKYERKNMNNTNTLYNYSENKTNVEGEEVTKLYIKIGTNTLTATLEDNSSAKALVEKLQQNDITIHMEDYGNFEKVGPLGFSLPRNDKQISTQPGDIILYQGASITIYYDTNNWNFTKLGKIDNISQKELKEILGTSDVTVTFTLNN